MFSEFLNILMLYLVRGGFELAFVAGAAGGVAAATKWLREESLS